MLAQHHPSLPAWLYSSVLPCSTLVSSSSTSRRGILHLLNQMSISTFKTMDWARNSSDLASTSPTYSENTCSGLSLVDPHTFSLATRHKWSPPWFSQSSDMALKVFTALPTQFLWWLWFLGKSPLYCISGIKFLLTSIWLTTKSHRRETKATLAQTLGDSSSLPTSLLSSTMTRGICTQKPFSYGSSSSILD